ncbi:uroporphyrinogen-III synthase [compost metagenome]
MVEEVTVYRNRPCEAGREAALRRVGEVDWALFASGSAFRNLVALLDDPQALKRVKLASIGPKTTVVMRELGFEPTVEAIESTLESLVEALLPR